MPERTDQKQHVAYLDNLRIGLTMLVIAHHSAIGFGGSGGWYYAVPAPEGSLAPALFTMMSAISQSFFMSLFFFIAAYFTPSSYDKKGLAGFLKGRLFRLGIPLLVYYFVLNASVVYLVFTFRDGLRENYFVFMAKHWFTYAGNGPLWFVQALLIFSGVYAAFRVLASRRDTPPKTIAFPGNKPILVFVLGIGALTFLIRLAFPAGWAISNLQLGYFPLYLCMFYFGIQARRSDWLSQITRKQANQWLVAVVAMIILLPIIMLLGGALEGGTEVFMGGWHWQAFFYAAWEPVLCVGISMKLLVCFRDRLGKSGPLARNAARSAYTAYILHPFFVVCYTYFFSQIPVGPLLQYTLMVPVTILCCFIVSDAVRRAPWLRKIL